MIKLRETMWAEMEPDVYGGDNLDEIIPRWRVSAEGDKGDSDTVPLITLDPRTFPPGTTVVISEPLCPQCGEIRHPEFPVLDGESIFTFVEKCDCGFNWDNWARDEYS